jgi:hypothetical protein
MSQTISQAVQNVVIVSGQFSANGNYSGWDLLGVERYHIPARMMNSLGYAKGANEQVEFPIYASVVKKSFPPRLDADGQPIPNPDGTFGIKDRPTVTALFKTLEQGITANVANGEYARRVNNAVRKAETASGLTEETLSTINDIV